MGFYHDDTKTEQVIQLNADIIYYTRQQLNN